MLRYKAGGENTAAVQDWEDARWGMLREGRNAMSAKSPRITRARIALLEKRVIAYWLEKYAGKKRRGRKSREEVTGYREQGAA